MSDTIDRLQADYRPRANKYTDPLTIADIREIFKTYANIKIPLTKAEKEVLYGRRKAHNTVTITISDITSPSTYCGINEIRINLEESGVVYLKYVDDIYKIDNNRVILSPETNSHSYSSIPTIPDNYILQDKEVEAVIETSKSYSYSSPTYSGFLATSTTNTYPYWTNASGYLPATFTITLTTDQNVLDFSFGTGGPSERTSSGKVTFMYDEDIIIDQEPFTASSGDVKISHTIDG